MSDVVSGDATPAQPSPQLQPVPGYQTTSGQFTAIFSMVAMILGLLGFHYSPEQVESWVQLIEKLLVTIGPFLAVVPVLMTYITSRGKIQSNTLMANAAIMSVPPTMELIEGKTASFAGGIGSLISGNDWKDPKRYEDLLHLAASVGVPGAAQADKINQSVHPADLITGILSMLHHRGR